VFFDLPIKPWGRGDMPWKPPCPGIQISFAAAAVAVCWLASGEQHGHTTSANDR